MSNKNKSTKSNNKKLIKKTDPFENLSPAEKRVRIAQDVLDQIRIGKFIPANGMWLADASNAEDNLFSSNDVYQDVQIQKILNKIPECTGCALGGLFMCAVKRANDLKVSDISSTEGPDISDIFDYMERKRFFTTAQMRLIELAFEDGHGGLWAHNTDLEEAAVDFFYSSDSSEDSYKISDPNERMRLIMENIIVHKGRFNPNKKPERMVFYSTPGFLTLVK